MLAQAMGVETDAAIGAVPFRQPDALVAFNSYLSRRVAREPLAYILGRREFWSLEFAVGPGVLVPRPETETLIEQAIKYFPDRYAALDVLDFGTGTGCLLAAFLSEYSNARGTGIDSSPEALGWARRNLAKHGLDNRCRLVGGDWAADLSGPADVILANPPYIRSGDFALLAPEVGLYEPRAALDGGADGLEAYGSLAPQIGRLLKPASLAFLEIGAGQGEAVSAILAADGLQTLEIAVDLAGIGRCVVAGHKDRARARLEKTVGTTAQNR